VRWFVRFALSAIMPTSGDLKGVSETALDPFLDRLAQDAPPLFRFGVVLASLFFCFSPIITIWIPLPAFALSKAQLRRHTEKASGHPVYLIRQITFLVKMVAGLCWSEDADVRARLGLEPLEPDPGTWRPSL
jgi:hypothetical protein